MARPKVGYLNSPVSLSTVSKMTYSMQEPKFQTWLSVISFLLPLLGLVACCLGGRDSQLFLYVWFISTIILLYFSLCTLQGWNTGKEEEKMDIQISYWTDTISRWLCSVCTGQGLKLSLPPEGAVMSSLESLLLLGPWASNPRASLLATTPLSPEISGCAQNFLCRIALHFQTVLLDRV